MPPPHFMKMGSENQCSDLAPTKLDSFNMQCTRKIASAKGNQRLCPRNRAEHPLFCDRCLGMASVKKLLAQPPEKIQEAVTRDPEARQCERLIANERQCKNWTIFEHGYCEKCAGMKSIMKLLNADKNRAENTRVKPKGEDVVDPRHRKELSGFEAILDFPQFYKWENQWIVHLRSDNTLIICAKILDGSLAALTAGEGAEFEQKEGVVCMKHVPKELDGLQLQAAS